MDRVRSPPSAKLCRHARRKEAGSSRCSMTCQQVMADAFPDFSEAKSLWSKLFPRRFSACLLGIGSGSNPVIRKTDHLHNPRRKSCRSFDLVSSGRGVLGHGGSECENSGPNPKTWLQGPRSNPQDRPPLYLSGLVPTCDIGRNSPKEDYLVSASWSVLGFCRRDKGGVAC